MIKQFFQEVLDRHIGGTRLLNFTSIGGGCINNAVRLATDRGTFFLKYTNESSTALFQTEAKGLTLLQDTATIRVPTTLGYGEADRTCYLLMEWIEPGHASQDFWEAFGRGLAAMHQITADQFGLDHNNFIGRLPQSNQLHATWPDFFIRERLLPQLRLAFDKGLIDRGFSQEFERIFQKLPQLIPQERPSLLHGDLWSGNFAVDTSSKPVLIDPAVHFGHRETELAFTHLFGGFDRSFYLHYHAHHPLVEGFEERIDLHNLYPLLVHVNLFGSSYLAGIENTLKRFA